jgi:hypothetical protein
VLSARAEREGEEEESKRCNRRRGSIEGGKRL